MSALKPFKLYYHGPSPNPWKVVIILEELGLQYELASVINVKSPEYLAVCPNGRVPALEDPNAGITLWESGSIIDYLIEVYDKQHALSYSTFPEKHLTKNWEHFQMSGQGPYFGQKAWFTYFHAEKIPSANEIKRVLGVFELQLSRTGKPYLVGDKVTYADLMFVPWNQGLPRLLGDKFVESFPKEFPRTSEWISKLNNREGVQKMEKAKTAALA